MGRTTRALFIASLALPLFLTACASGKKPLPPPVDPLKEQITILQKQLLELQNVQNETRRKVDELAGTASALDARVTTMESQRTAPPAATPVAPRTQPTKAKAPAKKTPAKKRAKKKRTR